MKDFTSLLALSLDGLRDELSSARRDLVRGRMGVKTGQEKNTSNYVDQKKYVARILTAMREKEISEIVL